MIDILRYLNEEERYRYVQSLLRPLDLPVERQIELTTKILQETLPEVRIDAAIDRILYNFELTDRAGSRSKEQKVMYLKMLLFDLVVPK